MRKTPGRRASTISVFSSRARGQALLWLRLYAFTNPAPQTTSDIVIRSQFRVQVEKP
jgi:hypothetical protein